MLVDLSSNLPHISCFLGFAKTSDAVSRLLCDVFEITEHVFHSTLGISLLFLSSFSTLTVSREL